MKKNTKILILGSVVAGAGLFLLSNSGNQDGFYYGGSGGGSGEENKPEETYKKTVVENVTKTTNVKDQTKSPLTQYVEQYIPKTIEYPSNYTPQMIQYKKDIQKITTGFMQPPDFKAITGRDYTVYDPFYLVGKGQTRQSGSHTITKIFDPNVPGSQDAYRSSLKTKKSKVTYRDALGRPI